MYKDLEKRRLRQREYNKEYQARKKEAEKLYQEQLRHRIAVAIVAAELLQESNG
jgi:hypothetical protein